jgi:hypothetical protein
MLPVVDFLDELPEPGDARRKVLTSGVLAELRANPGRWAVVRSYSYRHSPGQVKHPTDIELSWQHQGRDVNRRTVLYARAKPVNLPRGSTSP